MPTTCRSVGFSPAESGGQPYQGVDGSSIRLAREIGHALDLHQQLWTAEVGPYPFQLRR